MFYYIVILSIVILVLISIFRKQVLQSIWLYFFTSQIKSDVKRNSLLKYKNLSEDAPNLYGWQPDIVRILVMQYQSFKKNNLVINFDFRVDAYKQNIPFKIKHDESER